MQFSTDARIGRNVSEVADLAYIMEKGLKIARGTSEQWPIGTCSRCEGTIFNAPFLSSTEVGEFCSRVCHNVNKQVRAGGRPKLNKREQLKSKEARKVYARNHKRASRAGVSTKNPSQLIETKEVKSA